MESVGFKEWAAVCEAMGRGRQSIILRKGGIAEGRDGFSFKYRNFFLFPTWFHEQPQKVRWEGLSPSQNADLSAVALAKEEHRTPNTQVLPPDALAPPATEEQITISYAAQLESCHLITSWDVAEALVPLHILQPDVVRERFQYDEAPGLHVAFVRVFRIEPSWNLPNEKRYGGCRSWVNLPPSPNNIKLEPVLTDAQHADTQEQFLKIVGKADPIRL